ncbi:LuxR C-terminal-related transcriptional regulator [Kitasatospora sp. NPDC003701]
MNALAVLVTAAPAAVLGMAVLGRGPAGGHHPDTRTAAHQSGLFPRSTMSVRPAEPGTRLTERELEVVRLVANGLSNANIGARLYISEYTVRSHLARISSKLGATGRAHVVGLAVITRQLHPREVEIVVEAVEPLQDAA